MEARRSAVPVHVVPWQNGRVVRWLADNGDPRNGQVDLVDWIESIPFDETRNYVQRVLEAVPVEVDEKDTERDQGHD